jgi:hypothetical protein
MNTTANIHHTNQVFAKNEIIKKLHGATSYTYWLRVYHIVHRFTVDSTRTATQSEDPVTDAVPTPSQGISTRLIV